MRKKLEPDLRDAPTVFRQRLEALKRRGLFNDPKFKEAVLRAAKEIAEEQRAELAKQN